MKRNEAIRKDYLAPSVLVVDFVEQGVLCASQTYSPDDSTDMESVDLF